MHFREDTEFCSRIHRANGFLYYCGGAVVTHMIPDSRVTKRFFRQRAYQEGRVAAHPLTRGNSSATNLGRELLSTLKGCALMLGYYGMGAKQRGFNYELSVRSHVAYLSHRMLWGKTSPV